MLSNADFLAKFLFDTAENEPAKNLQNFANFANPNTEALGQINSYDDRRSCRIREVHHGEESEKTQRRSIVSKGGKAVESACG